MLPNAKILKVAVKFLFSCAILLFGLWFELLCYMDYKCFYLRLKHLLTPYEKKMCFFQLKLWKCWCSPNVDLFQYTFSLFIPMSCVLQVVFTSRYLIPCFARFIMEEK